MVVDGDSNSIFNTTFYAEPVPNGDILVTAYTNDVIRKVSWAGGGCPNSKNGQTSTTMRSSSIFTALITSNYGAAKSAPIVATTNVGLILNRAITSSMAPFITSKNFASTIAPVVATSNVGLIANSAISRKNVVSGSLTVTTFATAISASGSSSRGMSEWYFQS